MCIFIVKRAHCALYNTTVLGKEHIHEVILTYCVNLGYNSKMRILSIILWCITALKNTNVILRSICMVYSMLYIQCITDEY